MRISQSRLSIQQDSGALQKCNGQTKKKKKLGGGGWRTIQVMLKRLTRSTQQFTEDAEGVVQSLLVRYLLKKTTKPETLTL